MPYQTRIAKVEGDPEPSVAEAADLLRQGELVAFPTETVYGLGADATNPRAIQKIFEAKQRPADNPLIVHVAGRDMARAYSSQTSPYVDVLADHFWPGPLTVVLPAAALLRKSLCAGLDTVALRMPNHPLALALIAATGVGLAAPSANLSGKPSPTTAQHVFHDLGGRIPLILDGGPCRVGIESTVLDLSTSVPLILRPGMVTAADLTRVLGFPVAYADDRESKKRSPGTRYRHYSPRARVFLLDPSVSEASFQRLLTFLEHGGSVGYIGNRIVPARQHGLSLEHLEYGPESLGPNLYAALRSMDERAVASVVIDGIREELGGFTIMDRLKKAASFYFKTSAETESYLQNRRADEDNRDDFPPKNTWVPDRERR